MALRITMSRKERRFARYASALYHEAERGRKAVFLGSSPTDARGTVFVCHKGAFDHKLKTWGLVFVNDVRL
jgi:hypothetical protein